MAFPLDTILDLFRSVHSSGGDDEYLRVNGVGGFSPPAGTDAITVTYPSTTVEVYAFRTGGVLGTILMTVTLTYSTAAKIDLVSAVKT